MTMVWIMWFALHLVLLVVEMQVSPFCWWSKSKGAILFSWLLHCKVKLWTCLTSGYGRLDPQKMVGGYKWGRKGLPLIHRKVSSSILITRMEFLREKNEKWSLISVKVVYGLWTLLNNIEIWISNMRPKVAPPVKVRDMDKIYTGKQIPQILKL